MKECSKSIGRRLAESNYVRRYFVGKGIDIGGKPDPLVLYSELFPLMEGCDTWDWEHGDAQYMQGVNDDEFDFVFSSHCLEHMADPAVAMENWFRILKPGGYLIINVPDEDLYEQGVFPSSYNADHKTTWTIHKEVSWSPNSRNLLDLLRPLGAAADVRKIEVIDDLYRYSLPRFDQTLSPVAESAIELVLRKRWPDEVRRGVLFRQQQQPPPEKRRHFNQYIADQRTLRQGNVVRGPFTDENDL